MLVYEYVDNGNLEQWLHGQLGNHPAMSWDIRMKIILGTAKGYFLEPHVTYISIIVLSFVIVMCGCVLRCFHY